MKTVRKNGAWEGHPYAGGKQSAAQDSSCGPASTGAAMSQGSRPVPFLPAASRPLTARPWGPTVSPLTGFAVRALSTPRWDTWTLVSFPISWSHRGPRPPLSARPSIRRRSARAPERCA